MALGLQWRGMDSGTLPRLSEHAKTEIAGANAGLDWSAESSAGLEAQLLASARAEHARWMIDRAIEGFRQGPRLEGSENETKRDNERRWHNLMKPFDQLEDDEKPSDLALLRKWLDREADQDAPLAHWRNVAQVSLDTPHMVEGADPAEATELEVTLAAGPDPVTPEALSTLKAIVKSWSARDQACRLHLRLGTPIRELRSTPQSRSAPMLPEVRALLAMAHAPGLIIDVTRLAPD